MKHREPERLTPRERHVLFYVLRGYGRKEIALRTGLSVRMARFHLSGLLKKVSCESCMQLIGVAYNPAFEGDPRRLLIHRAMAFEGWASMPKGCR